MSNRNVVMSHRRQTGSTSVFCDLLQDFLQNIWQRRAEKKSTAARANRVLYHHSVWPITVKSSLLVHCKMTCHMKTRTKIKCFIFFNQKKIHVCFQSFFLPKSNYVYWYLVTSFISFLFLFFFQLECVENNIFCATVSRLWNEVFGENN